MTLSGNDIQCLKTNQDSNRIEIPAISAPFHTIYLHYKMHRGCLFMHLCFLERCTKGALLPRISMVSRLQISIFICCGSILSRLDRVALLPRISISINGVCLTVSIFICLFKCFNFHLCRSILPRLRLAVFCRSILPRLHRAVFCRSMLVRFVKY